MVFLLDSFKALQTKAQLAKGTIEIMFLANWCDQNTWTKGQQIGLPFFQKYTTACTCKFCAVWNAMLFGMTVMQDLQSLLRDIHKGSEKKTGTTVRRISLHSYPPPVSSVEFSAKYRLGLIRKLTHGGQLPVSWGRYCLQKIVLFLNDASLYTGANAQMRWMSKKHIQSLHMCVQVWKGCIDTKRYDGDSGAPDKCMVCRFYDERRWDGLMKVLLDWFVLLQPYALKKTLSCVEHYTAVTRSSLWYW